MRDRIGGVLDLAALALLSVDAAELHRPRDEATLRVAAMELRSRGMTERDIGQALGVGETAVRQLLCHGVRALGW
jgi:hypothetical protein